MSVSRQKILFIGHEATRTGAPFVLLHFLRWLRQNSDIDFEILLRRGGELLGDFQALAPTRVLHRGLISSGVPGFIPRLRRKFDLNPSLPRQLRQLYPREVFPLVYSNTVTNGELVSRFSALGHRLLCHAHEMRFGIEMFGGPPAVHAAQVTDDFIAVSESVGHDLRETLHVPAEKITVIHPFAQPSIPTRDTQARARKTIRAELRIDDTDVVVGMCGAAHWRKGSDLFLLLAKAVPKLQPTRRHIFLWIGAKPGSDPERQMIHDRTLLGLEETVKLIPPVANPLDYLSALDVFTLTSREDSFSLVSLESASLGIPVICFAGGGGCPDLVGLDEGLAVPYLDIPAMAQAVVALSEDASRRRRVGEVLRERAARFTVETQAPKLLAVVEKNRLQR